MSSKNISISDEAYNRLKKFKGKNESFTDVINRLTSKSTLLELRGTLSKNEADSIRTAIEESRKAGRERMERLFEESEKQ
jgi:predicted CopG family antitoxin